MTNWLAVLMKQELAAINSIAIGQALFSANLREAMP
jgi:hypothetical protein